MGLTAGQPRVRFASHFNPGNIAGLSYEPKIIAITKDITATETAEVVATLPADTFVSRVIAVCSEISASTDVTFNFGFDGNVDAFIDGADWTLETVGNSATNIGSTAADYPNGYYMTQADNLALTIAGSTVTDGQVQILLEYFEMGEIFQDGGIHIEL